MPTHIHPTRPRRSVAAWLWSPILVFLLLAASPPAHAQLNPPRLTALTRESPLTTSPDATVQFRFAVTPGTIPTQSITLALATKDRSEYRVVRATATANGIATFTVDRTWVNGSYTLVSVELTDNWNRRVSYLPDGSVVSGTFADPETRHTFDFSALGLVVSGAAFQAALPIISALTVVSPSTVSPGQSAQFRLAGSAEGFPVARLQLIFTPTAGGATLSTSLETTSLDADFSLPITSSLTNGRYRLSNVLILNRAGEGYSLNPSSSPPVMVASFASNGFSYFVPATFSGSVEFTVTGASTDRVFPRLASWSLQGQSREATAGETVRFSYATTLAATDSPVQKIKALITGPYGATLSYTGEPADGTITLPVTSDWVSGTYTFSRITLTDSLSRTTSYLPAGGSSAGLPGVRDSIPVPADAFRFDVRATTVNPFFNVQPAAETPLAANGTARLTAVGVGLGTLTYQWYRGERGDTRQPVAADPLSPASFLSQFTVPASAAGTYWVRLTSAGATADSRAARVTVVAPAAFLAPTFSSAPTAQTVPIGSRVTFSVTAVGDPPLTYQWDKDRVAIDGATSPTLSLTGLTASAAGFYSVTITNAAGTTTTNPVILTVTPSAWLSNLSVRSSLAASQLLTVGFVVGGGAKPVLVRAAGPVLATFGLTGAMADPRLDLYQGSIRITSNDDWAAPLATTFASLGAFAFSGGSKDAALLQSLTGACSAQVTGTTAGAVLVEGYDAGNGSAVRLVNVSARNRVGTDSDILIAGFTIAGTGTLRVLVRAVGPTLASFGATNVLADPKLELFNAAGTKFDENDNWPATLAATFSSVGAFSLPAASKDAALITTLVAGQSYTVQASGIGNTTGEGLIEIYELP